MPKLNQPIYLLSAVRTPIGAYLGTLSSLSAPSLGAVAIRAALARANLDPREVGEVYMGNVLSAGVGQAPARQAALAAGIENRVPATTVSKVCGSGMQALILAAKGIALGDFEVAVAGGMESMSKVPYYLDKARQGYRMGDGKLVDGMIRDGLWDPYNDFHMGSAGELCAAKYDCTREAQDAFAKESYARALRAIASGAFESEIVPVAIEGRKGESQSVDVDEEPGRGKPEKFPQLRPAFDKHGTITAANASSVNDGASAIVLASEAATKRLGVEPLARLLGYGGAAQAPEWFTTAPAAAVETTLSDLGLERSQIALWEINEAFSCVTMACAQLAQIDLETVNVNGGAVALGHPIGATGARIVTTLVHALKARKKKLGLATLCIGGGEALATVIERP